LDIFGSPPGAGFPPGLRGYLFLGALPIVSSRLRDPKSK
jgi:hypothetical protein